MRGGSPIGGTVVDSVNFPVVCLRMRKIHLQRYEYQMPSFG